MGRFIRGLAMFCSTLALVAASSTWTWAQEITATISGSVTDQTGAALPGAVVTARETGKGISTEVVTSSTGRYTLPYLTNGEYDITFAMSGFKPYVAKSIRLHVNDRLEINANLQG